MIHATDPLIAARAEALFTSELAAGSQLGRDEVTAAIRRAVHLHGGIRGCAIAVAGEYGDHPETAAPRMRWALRVVEATFPETTDAVPAVLEEENAVRGG